MKVGIKRLNHAQDLPLPHYATTGSAGLDLLAAVDQEITLAPGQRMAVPTGIPIELPHGVEAQVRPRSGLAFNHGITCLNSPATIDSDYRGEIKVILINHGDEPFTVQSGERIAQLVIAKVARVTLDEQATLDDSARGAGGFGHTGR